MSADGWSVIAFTAMIPPIAAILLRRAHLESRHDLKRSRERRVRRDQRLSPFQSRLLAAQDARGVERLQVDGAHDRERFLDDADGFRREAGFPPAVEGQIGFRGRALQRPGVERLRIDSEEAAGGRWLLIALRVDVLQLIFYFP